MGEERNIKSSEKRQENIIEILKEGPKRPSEIKKRLEEKYNTVVAHPTISKDLMTLVESGFVIRKGPRFTLAGLWDRPFIIRSLMNRPQKRYLGKFIAGKYIKPDRIVVFDTGSTMVEIAKSIVSHHAGPLLFETNNIAAFLAVIGHTTLPIVKIWGGQVDKAIAATLIEEQEIIDLVEKHGKIVLIGLGCISKEGDFFAHDRQQVPMKRGLLRSDSERTIIVVDSSKIGIGGIAQVANLQNDINKRYIEEEGRSYIIVTNSEPPEEANSEAKEIFKETLSKLEEVKGITVEYAEQ